MLIDPELEQHDEGSWYLQHRDTFGNKQTMFKWSLAIDFVLVAAQVGALASGAGQIVSRMVITLTVSVVAVACVYYTVNYPKFKDKLRLREEMIGVGKLGVVYVSFYILFLAVSSFGIKPERDNMTYLSFV